MKGKQPIAKEYHKTPVVLIPKNVLDTVLASYIHLGIGHLLGYVFCCFSCIMNRDGIYLSQGSNRSSLRVTSEPVSGNS